MLSMAERDAQNKQVKQDKQAGALFDRRLVAARRARALADLNAHDFLHQHVARELSERLQAIERPFKVAAELGARTGVFAHTEAARALDRLYGVDLVPPGGELAHNQFLIADEERLPFREGALDLIVAPLCLHVVNDLPGVLTQARRALRPDGLFLGTLFGGETLTELRAAFMEAELETTGGAAPRIAPVVDIRDAGALLQRAGFALPVADADHLSIGYDSALDLMADLKGMGESNVLTDRHGGFLRRDTIARTAEIYAQRFGGPETGPKTRVRASFEIVYLSGWAPDESQQKPLRPGSAKTRLADALGTKEIPANDRSRD